MQNQEIHYCCHVHNSLPRKNLKSNSKFKTTFHRVCLKSLQLHCIKNSLQIWKKDAWTQKTLLIQICIFYSTYFLHDCLLHIQTLWFTLECTFCLYPGQCYVLLAKYDLCVYSLTTAACMSRNMSEKCLWFYINTCKCSKLE